MPFRLQQYLKAVFTTLTPYTQLQSIQTEEQLKSWQVCMLKEKKKIFGFFRIAAHGTLMLNLENDAKRILTATIVTIAVIGYIAIEVAIKAFETRMARFETLFIGRPVRVGALASIIAVGTASSLLCEYVDLAYLAWIHLSTSIQPIILIFLSIFLVVISFPRQQ